MLPAKVAFVGGDFDHRNPDTLSLKRNMFKQLYNPNSLGLNDFVTGILRQMPIVHQWYDHDAGLDNCDKTYPYWNLSYQAFKEYVPSYSLPSVPYGIWQHFQYAQVDFFERPSECGLPDNSCVSQSSRRQPCFERLIHSLHKLYYNYC